MPDAPDVPGTTDTPGTSDTTGTPDLPRRRRSRGRGGRGRGRGRRGERPEQLASPAADGRERHDDREQRNPGRGHDRSRGGFDDPGAWDEGDGHSEPRPELEIEPVQLYGYELSTDPVNALRVEAAANRDDVTADRGGDEGFEEPEAELEFIEGVRLDDAEFDASEARGEMAAAASRSRSSRPASGDKRRRDDRGRDGGHQAHAEPEVDRSGMTEPIAIDAETRERVVALSHLEGEDLLAGIRDLGRRRSPAGLPFLNSLLSREDLAVAHAACEALGEIGDIRALEALAKIVEADRDEDLVRTAARAIGLVLFLRDRDYFHTENLSYLVLRYLR